MTTGEMLGIGIGLASLGVGVYFVVSTRRGGDPTQASPGGYVTQVRPSAPPSAPPAPVQQAANDVAQWVQTAGETVNGAINLFNTISGLFAN